LLITTSNKLLTPVPSSRSLIMSTRLKSEVNGKSLKMLFSLD
jgi:hypothetical protein